jgi:hypothetical protein
MGWISDVRVEWGRGYKWFVGVPLILRWQAGWRNLRHETAHDISVFC